MKFNVLTTLFALLLVISSFSLVSAVPEAVLRIVPEQPCWSPNGLQYKVNLYANNIALNPENTSLVMWKLVRPLGINNQQMTIVNFSVPLQSNDFFAGVNTNMGSNVGATWGQQWRVTNTGVGVSNRNGTLASYWFTIAPGTPLGQYSFNAIDVEFRQPNEQPQPFRIETVPFTLSIKPSLCAGLMTARAR